MAIEKLILQQVQNAPGETQELAALRALASFRQSVAEGNHDFSTEEAIKILQSNLKSEEDKEPVYCTLFDQPLGQFLKDKRKTLEYRPGERANRIRPPRGPGITTEYFARRAKLSVSYLYNIERGRALNVSADILKEIAAAADLTPDEQQAFVERYRYSNF